MVTEEDRIREEDRVLIAARDVGRVLVEEAVIFLDESLAEFGSVGGLQDGESLGLAGEDLAEVGDVAVDGPGAVLGQVDDLGDGLALDEEETADLLLVGQGRSHVVDGAATW